MRPTTARPHGARPPRAYGYASLLLLLLVAPIGAIRAEAPPAIKWFDEVPLVQLQAVGASANLPIVLIFSAPWCGFCRRLESETLASPIVRLAMVPYIGARFNVEAEPGGELARRYNVTGLPGIVVISTEGQVLGRQDGFVDDQHFAAFLDKARTTVPSPGELAERALAGNADPGIVLQAALSLADAGRPADARQVLGTLIDRTSPAAPERLRAELVLASLDAAAGPPDEAIGRLRHALADGRDPIALREAYLYLLTLLRDAGRHDEERATWEEVAGRLTDDVVIQEDFVRSLVQNAAPPEHVLEAARHGATLAPDAAWPLAARSDALLRLRRPAEAMEAVNEAIRRDPGDVALRVLRLRIMDAARQAPAAPSAANGSGRGK